VSDKSLRMTEIKALQSRIDQDQGRRFAVARGQDYILPHNYCLQT
jgi:hypothetical protein